MVRALGLHLADGIHVGGCHLFHRFELRLQAVYAVRLNRDERSIGREGRRHRSVTQRVSAARMHTEKRAFLARGLQRNQRRPGLLARALFKPRGLGLHRGGLYQLLNGKRSLEELFQLR
ncbi:hypothetical protein LYNGBM3L_75550 [Moorena producens 3L]|uniref:Uncharacterized protein n=1 Tax=Moorena producens 3L TaxID=489825 RepID=F4XRE0_9CYAN|nr:hypothetical protein LYNGBM3L_75550 [Moorena producens 3L]